MESENNIIDLVQNKQRNMLDYVLSQPELKQDFEEAMSFIGKPEQEWTPNDATKWLTEYENKWYRERKQPIV